MRSARRIDKIETVLYKRIESSALELQSIYAQRIKQILSDRECRLFADNVHANIAQGKSGWQNVIFQSDDPELAPIFAKVQSDPEAAQIFERLKPLYDQAATSIL